MVDRIRQLLAWQQLSPTQFADFIGVGRPVISHILSERNKPSLDVVQRIIGAFPAVSLPWLLSGAGEMLVAADQPNSPVPPATIAAPIAPLAPPVAATPALAAQNASASDVAAASLGATATTKSVPRRTSVPQAPALARFVANKPPTARPVESSSLAAAPAPVESLPPLDTPPDTIAKVTAIPTAGTVQEPVLAPTPAIAEPAVAPAILGDAAAMLPFLAEPGKAIRRIVIFYRDGSFADYLPEG